jgi:hypothetical protein
MLAAADAGAASDGKRRGRAESWYYAQEPRQSGDHHQPARTRAGMAMRREMWSVCTMERSSV